MEAARGAKKTGSINSEIKDRQWRRINMVSEIYFGIGL
jgi:hypothetical protein